MVIWSFLNTLLTYFIAILQWSIGHPFSASIDGGFWLELVVRQMMFSHIPPKQCASRWLWGVHVIFFLAGSILIRYGKFLFDFFVECVLSNHIFFALFLHLFLTVQFFFPQLLVGNYSWPPNPKNVPKTSIDKSLKLLCSVICHKPTLLKKISLSL